ncbi:MAG: ankyrin repeat domain-containing protein, partial [Planctomycetaceae bacterium]
MFFDDLRQQALCTAIFSGDLSAVEKLINDGASGSAEGRHGVTPLFWAYLSRKYKVYEYLLAHGADPNVSVNLPRELSPGEIVFQFRPGDSVLYMSAKNRMSEQWLCVALKHSKPRQWTHPGSGNNLLHAFLEGRDGGAPQTPETLDQIIKFGVDLDLQGDDGYTPLCYAVSDLHYNLATRLLKAGASAACYDSSDEQIIHTLAQQYKNRQTPGSRSPEDKARWDQSQTKKDWDELIALLREKGFKLTDALLDLERAEAGNRGAYMYQRRLRREDRFCCGSGRKLQDQLG